MTEEERHAADAAPEAPAAGNGAAPEAEATKKSRRRGGKKKKKGGASAEGGSDAPAAVEPKDIAEEGAAPDGAVGSDKLTQMRLIQLMQQQELQRRLAAVNSGTKEHRFWNTQPVPQFDEAQEPAAGAEGESVNEPIEVKAVDDVSPEPLQLPAAYEWAVVDIPKDGELDEVYRLLTENYVEDDDNMFRFDYSRSFLRWALLPPEWNAQFHLGVRHKATNSLVAFITGIPATMNVHGRSVRTVEINFLCVHKRLRSKRLAPVLIKEITRRVNRADIWQAVYTAGVVLPRPVAQCRYFHRSLNPKKLIEVGFSRLGQRMTMSRTIKLYRVAPEPARAFAPMEARDVPHVQRLLSEYLGKFKLHPELNEDEVAHWLLPREQVVNTYVLRGGDGAVTDFFSFYYLPSSVIGNPKHDHLSAVYAYYNVATSMSLTDLMRDALVMAAKNGVDVFNALNLQDNEQFLEELKFGPGDGNLSFYLYNWRCQPIVSGEVGLVLL